MIELANLCTPEQLTRLNRVRLHQQVLFGSDIIDAGGRCIDKKYLWECPTNESWSTIRFPKEIPPNRDFAFWRKMLPHPRGQGRLHLGSLLSDGHKIWNWKYDAEECVLYHQQDDNTDNVYYPSNSTGLPTRANAWELVKVNQPRANIGMLCTVEKIKAGEDYRIVSHMPPTHHGQRPNPSERY